MPIVNRHDVLAGPGQVVSGGIVSNGGQLDVLSGGSAVDTYVYSGTAFVFAGGMATGTILNGGTTDEVYGTDTGAIVQTNAALNVQPGGLAISSVIDGGYFTVSSGGSAVAPVVRPGNTLAVSAGGQVSGAVLGLGARIVFIGPGTDFRSGETASFDYGTDVLTISNGGTVSSLQFTGNYAGDSFAVGTPPTFGGTEILLVKGNILVPTPSRNGLIFPLGSSQPLTTSTPLQTTLAQDIVALAAQAPGSQTVYLPGQGYLSASTTLSSQVFIDLPERADTITGAAAIPVADILLANPGATYVTGGTTASIVVVADGASATIINNGVGNALIAATGNANITLEGLAGANEFITGGGGQDAVLLDGAANALETNGTDTVLVGGPSTIVTRPGGLDNVLMSAGTALSFIGLSAAPAASTVTGAAGATVVTAGPGSTVFNAGAGSEAFFIDTSAGNITLNAAAGGGDFVTFIKDADTASATIVVNNFTPSDTLAIHGYSAVSVQAAASGAVLALSDGSQVRFNAVGVAAVQQALRVV